MKSRWRRRHRHIYHLTADVIVGTVGHILRLKSALQWKETNRLVIQLLTNHFLLTVTSYVVRLVVRTTRRSTYNNRNGDERRQVDQESGHAQHQQGPFQSEPCRICNVITWNEIRAQKPNETINIYCDKIEIVGIWP